MKVILNTDLEGKGDLGDIVEVKPGFARNYLFPKELALPVNKQNLEMMKARRKKVEKELEIQRLSATEQKVKLEELSLTFEKKAGESDVLFGSVTTSDIEKRLEEMGIEIDRKKLHLDEPIKRLGHYTCKIKLVKGVDADLKIEVVAEGEPIEAEPKETDESPEKEAVKADAGSQPKKEVAEEVEPVEAEPNESDEIKEKKAEKIDPGSKGEEEVEEESEPQSKSEKKVTESVTEIPEPKSEEPEKSAADKTGKKEKATKESPDNGEKTGKDDAENKKDLKESIPDQESESEKKNEDPEAEEKSPEV